MSSGVDGLGEGKLSDIRNIVCKMVPVGKAEGSVEKLEDQNQSK